MTEPEIRSCVAGENGTLRERIIARDDTARRYSYEIETAPMPIGANRNTIEVRTCADGAEVVWSTDVEPDDLAEMLAPIYGEGLANLKAILEQPATH